MKVSVVICTYNGESYIKEQLDSIISQTIPIDEIVLCDDCSTDNTVNIAKEIIKNNNVNSHIEINQSKLGVTQNFAKAISLTHGEIVFFSDQDDIWVKNKVEEHLKIYSSKPNVNLVFSNSFLFDEEGIKSHTTYNVFSFCGKKRRVFEKNQFRAILMGWVVTGATMSARKEFILKYLPFGNNLLHDQWLSLCAAETNSLYSIDECLIKYRQHSRQVVGAKKKTIQQKIHMVCSKQDANAYNSLLPVLTNPLCIKEIMSYVDFLNFRIACKSRNAFIRIGLCLKNIKKYRKYKVNPFLSILKDMLTSN